MCLADASKVLERACCRDAACFRTFNVGLVIKNNVTGHQHSASWHLHVQGFHTAPPWRLPGKDARSTHSMVSPCTPTCSTLRLESGQGN